MASQNNRNFTLGGICDSVNAIDVLVPITPEAVALAGGDQTLVTSAVQAAILTSNEVYFNSELSLRVRAVDFLFLEDPEPTGATALGRLSSDPADGVFDEIQPVTSPKPTRGLISGNDYAFCGVAFLGPARVRCGRKRSSAAWPATPLSTNLATTWDVAMLRATGGCRVWRHGPGHR